MEAGRIRRGHSTVNAPERERARSSTAVRKSARSPAANAQNARSPRRGAEGFEGRGPGLRLARETFELRHEVGREGALAEALAGRLEDRVPLRLLVGGEGHDR